MSFSNTRAVLPSVVFPAVNQVSKVNKCPINVYRLPNRQYITKAKLQFAPSIIKTSTVFFIRIGGAALAVKYTKDINNYSSTLLQI